MKAHYTAANGRLTIEVEGADVKAVFEGVAQAQEIFDAQHQCGCCKSKYIRYGFRQVDSYKFYELRCNSCGAAFSFGQKKEGGALFPKRKDEDNNPLPDHGWLKYEGGEKGERHEPQQAAAAAAPRSTPRPAGAPRPVPTFASWDEAQDSPHWGEQPIMVEGVTYRLNAQREYTAAPAAAAPGAK
jgi:hypothetical protein